MFLVKLEFFKLFFGNSNFPTPVNIGILWNIGFSIILFFLFQMFSGIFLSFYVNLDLSVGPHFKLYVVKEMKYGWLFLYSHSIIPTLLFFFMYIHIFKNLLYPMYSFFYMWFTGFIIYLIFMIMSFTGYSLVLGSMGYWAMIVVGNLFQYIFGDIVVNIILYEIQGGITNLSVSKMFTYHYLLSIFSFLIIFLHVWFLHKGGSSGIVSNYCDSFGFSLFLFMKDICVSLVLVLLFFMFLFFYPEMFFSLDNYLEMNIYSVPEELNAEWYLSLFFILLSSVDSKLMGVVLMVLVFFYILIMFLVKDLFGFSYLPNWFYLFIIFSMFNFIFISFYLYGNSLWSTSIILYSFMLVILDSTLFEFSFLKILIK